MTIIEYDAESKKLVDELLEDLEEISVPIIQRHLRWGYNRAYRGMERIIDEGRVYKDANSIMWKVRR